MDCLEACIDDDGKGTKEEKGHLHVCDEGDPDWTPEEADNAYQQAGDDNCDQKPTSRYKFGVVHLQSYC